MPASGTVAASASARFAGRRTSWPAGTHTSSASDPGANPNTSSPAWRSVTPGPGGVDDPGEVDAGDRVPGPAKAGREADEERGAPNHVPVASEDGRGADAHADLAGTGLRPGKFLEREEVRRPVPPVDDRLHLRGRLLGLQCKWLACRATVYIQCKSVKHPESPMAKSTTHAGPRPPEPGADPAHGHRARRRARHRGAHDAPPRPPARRGGDVALQPRGRTRTTSSTAWSSWSAAEFEVPTGAPDWKASIRSSTISARQVLRRHPWASSVIESRARSGPNRLRLLDATIGVLTGAGFAMPVVIRTLMALDSHTYGFTLQEQAWRVPRRGRTRDGRRARRRPPRRPTRTWRPWSPSWPRPGPGRSWSSSSGSTCSSTAWSDCFRRTRQAAGGRGHSPLDWDPSLRWSCPVESIDGRSCRT